MAGYLLAWTVSSLISRLVGSLDQIIIVKEPKIFENNKSPVHTIARNPESWHNNLK